MLRGSLRLAGVSSLIIGIASCGSPGTPGKPAGKKDGGMETSRRSLRIVSAPVQNAAVGEPVRYRVATSFAGAEITAVQLPPNARIDSSGNLTWTPTESQSGPQTFRVRARAADQETTQEFTITASRARVQTSQQVDPRSAQTSTVSVDAPLSPIRGAAVQIQPGSLVETVTHPITISSLENAPMPPAARIAGVAAKDMQPVELGPSGTAFRKPVRVQLPVSNAVASRGRPQVQTYDYGTGKWTKVKVLSYDEKQRTVIAEVTHFSTYVATPAANVFAPTLTRGGIDSACSESLIVRAPIVLPFGSIPAATINGYTGQAATMADVLAGLAAGQALQVMIRADARTADGSGTDSGWLLMSAAKRPDGKLKVQVSSNGAGASVLKIPEALAPADPETVAFLSGARAHFVFAKLGSLAGGVVVKLDASLYLVAAEDAGRTPPGAVNALVTEEVEARTLVHDAADGAGYDHDCDGAPTAFDTVPQGDAPPVLTGSPASPLRLTVAASERLAVKANVADVTFTWTASDPSLTLATAGGEATIAAALPGLFKVEVVGKKGSGETRYVWDVVVDSAEAMSRNTAPAVAISAPTTVVRVGEPLALTAVGMDAEQTELAYRWSAKVAGLLSATGGEVVTFTGAAAGEYAIECVASDGVASSAPAVFLVTVLSATANRPPGAPEVTPLVAALTHESGVPVRLTLEATATDPDGDRVTYTFAPGLRVPRSVSLTPMGAAATVATATDGVFVFYVTAEDSKGAKSPFTAVKVTVGPLATSGTDDDKDGHPQDVDCNDKDATVFPGAREVCGDGVDQSCDGRDLAGGDCDSDDDRYGSAQGDCDDADPNRNPGAPERCDGIDNNCNRVVDEGFDVGKGCTVGVGACQARGVTACSASFTAVVCTGEAGRPVAEHCDGIDNDCNGAVDDTDLGATGEDVKSCGGCGTACRVAANAVAACLVGGCTYRCADGFADLDRNPDNGCECGATNRGAEICDGLDNDCNGAIDDGAGEPFYPGPEGTVGVGVCTAGKRTCQSARLVVTADPRLPATEVCDGLDNDCNGKADETFDLMRDPRNCGGCGVSCPGTCDMGRCLSAAVDGGAPLPYDGAAPPITCSGTKSNVCTDERGGQFCTSVAWDPSNCGACGKRCEGSQTCERGSCVAVSAGCTPQAPNACQTPRGSACVHLAFDPANCGSCGNVCASGTVCAEGRCVAQPSGDLDGGTSPDACRAPLIVCKDPAGAPICTDPARDLQNCGGCGNVCVRGTQCYEGRCVMDASGTYDGGTPPACTAPMTMCKDQATSREYCTDVTRDPANCGGCGNYCMSGTTCMSGRCVTTTITDGGAPPPPTCVSPLSSCKDPTGTREFCADLARDWANCGACGKSCATGEYCHSGVCGTMPPPTTCTAPLVVCKDATGTREYCADTTRDAANCGGCGRVCAAEQYCTNSTCISGTTTPPVCAAPMMMCKDATGTREYCADTTQDPANCGGCGKVCPSGASCANGACTATMPPPTCVAPMLLCKNATGTESCTDPSTDAVNCGACGRVCGSGSYCSAGQCMSMTTAPPPCAAPNQLCKDPTGREYCSDPYTDNNSCGGCGIVCKSGTACSQGKCTATSTASCPQGFAACLDAAGAQYCADLLNDGKNCGRCGNPCASGICKEGSCAQ